MPELHAPHRHIQTASAREQFLIELFDTLWVRYRGRMDYVRKYEAVIESHRFLIHDRDSVYSSELCNVFADDSPIHRVNSVRTSPERGRLRREAHHVR
jgi:hypothetical protein